MSLRQRSSAFGINLGQSETMVVHGAQRQLQRTVPAQQDLRGRRHAETLPVRREWYTTQAVPAPRDLHVRRWTETDP